MNELVIDILPKPAILGDAKVMPASDNSQSSQRLFYAPKYLYPLPTQKGGGEVQFKNGQPLAMRKLLAGSLPISLLRFLFRSFDMPASNEVTTVVRETPALTPAPVRHYWELFATDGPADLYRSFALEAVDSYLKPLGNIEEEQLDILMQAVNLAVDVALKAARVPDSWLPQYEAALSAVRGGGE